MQYLSQNELGVPAKIRPAVSLLLEAFQYADQTGTDSWEFAVELDDLTSLDLTRTDFRWLVRQGIVEHQREVTLEGDDGREFRATGDLTFSNRTCFILTAKGLSVARELDQLAFSNNSASLPLVRVDCACKTTDFSQRSNIRNGEHYKPATCLPTWDAERRLLCLNGKTVKHFKWTAMNQEAVLATFEEEGWPARIYDPLPPKPEQDSKRRLSDTIKCLNRKQQNRLIHFRGDGTGEAVLWEPASQNGVDFDTAG
ncbi:hypothetical protein [Gimesia algae]|uniref:Uncharacterized protein n=1 Tax=Gimesia algae TaxID=2527971 RepID=A0A517VBQ7_9PLAN|nr:hypothetical protein [Gimesia algae]QDT90443.1 hypothetical protein Pan161_20950 [Gimesia algae]